MPDHREAVVDVELLRDTAALGDAAELLASIWGRSSTDRPIRPELLRVLAHTAGYVGGARSPAGELVGVSVGLLARDERGWHLHSHISGVAAGHRDQGIGYALKQHQRQWAASQGLDRVVWTFDPLVRRNAWFNLAKLGARVTSYHEDFYGSMDDAVNAGDLTDRAVVEWSTNAPGPEPPAADACQPPADTVILAAGNDLAPMPRLAHGPILHAWVPEDVVAVRLADPDLAQRWRQALRRTFGRAIEDGYVATGMSRDGWYRLERAVDG